MKLWQKIYLFSTLLLIFTLNIAGFLLIQRFHNNLIKQEVDKSLNEHNLIISELNFNATLIHKYSSYPFNLERSISSLMSPYSISTHNNSFYQILDSNYNLIYTDPNFPISPSREEFENLSDGKTYYIIRPIDESYYLYICRLSTIHNKPTIIYYAKDLSMLYAEKYHYYTFFFKLDIIICCIFAFFMLFISRLITRPIHTLIRSTKEITSGKYSARVQINSKDEFKILANHFNLMAQTIEDKMMALELSNEAKETFIQNFTHELKTPLTSIIGYANFMRTSKYNEALFMQATDYIYKEGKRLEQMAFKMMDLIYTQSEQINLELKDLLEVITDTKTAFEPRLTAQSITLDIQGSSAFIMLDEILIQMLLSNLLENAIKASKPNSKILMTIIQDTTQVTLSITDYGIGIPTEHLKQLCEPFYVVDKARSRKNNGVGIGLSICQKIAILHHANLTIKSQVDYGTTVSLTFTTF